MLQRPQSVRLFLFAVVVTTSYVVFLLIWVKLDATAAHLYVINAWRLRMANFEGELLDALQCYLAGQVLRSFVG